LDTSSDLHKFLCGAGTILVTENWHFRHRFQSDLSSVRTIEILR